MAKVDTSKSQQWLRLSKVNAVGNAVISSVDEVMVIVK